MKPKDNSIRDRCRRVSARYWGVIWLVHRTLRLILFLARRSARIIGGSVSCTRHSDFRDIDPWTQFSRSSLRSSSLLPPPRRINRHFKTPSWTIWVVSLLLIGSGQAASGNVQHFHGLRAGSGRFPQDPAQSPGGRGKV